MLQRGRARLSAEGPVNNSGGASNHSASTGPRSIERGGIYYKVANHLDQQLQRGRARLSAEGLS